MLSPTRITNVNNSEILQRIYYLRKKEMRVQMIESKGENKRMEK